MKVLLRVLYVAWPILFSPLLWLTHYLEFRYQYTSEILDAYIFPSAGGFVAILVLLFYRRLWQYLLSWVLMAVFMIVFVPVVLQSVSLSGAFSSLETMSIVTAFVESGMIHVMALIGFWFFKRAGIFGARNEKAAGIEVESYESKTTPEALSEIFNKRQQEKVTTEVPITKSQKTEEFTPNSEMTGELAALEVVNEQPLEPKSSELVDENQSTNNSVVKEKE